LPFDDAVGAQTGWTPCAEKVRAPKHPSALGRRALRAELRRCDALLALAETAPSADIETRSLADHIAMLHATLSTQA
jgi:hypothetical protein